jgi:uncharacterized protein YdhG (YjbR/CyaY superfamily)
MRNPSSLEQNGRCEQRGVDLKMRGLWEAHMKKTKAGDGGSQGKGVRASARGKRITGQGKNVSASGKSAARNVDEYIARVPEGARSRLREMRAAIRSAVPAGAVEIISYGIPAFKLKKVLVWFAAFSGHCSLFPTASVIEEFRDELGGFTTSKGTVQFPTDKALPVALIKKLVKARVVQCEKAQRS